jgi:glycosyltransferase involved in cell wall biosynthesis
MATSDAVRASRQANHELTFAPDQSLGADHNDYAARIRVVEKLTFSKFEPQGAGQAASPRSASNCRNSRVESRGFRESTVKFTSIFQNPDRSPATSSAEATLRDADTARDNRNWTKAAELYREYLASTPDHDAIWVQFGHVLKESGDLPAAEDAYKRSLELNPKVADTHLQLGHMYNKLHNVPAAVSAYREAYRLDPMLLDAYRELRSLGVSTDDIFSGQNASLPREPAIFIDLSDVFFYLRHHATVSGIQRVQLGIARALIAMGEDKRAGVSFLAERDGELYVGIDNLFITGLAKELSRDKVNHARLKEIMEVSIERGPLYRPVAGDILLILGAFWVLQNVAERIIALRRKGVRVGTLIHDIIPISHPEFCERDLTDAFRSYFYSVLSVVNFILTVSDYTGKRVREFMDEQGIPRAPILTLKSAHKTWEPSEHEAVAVSPAVASLLKQKYILYVSTIEIRKNHTYLFRIWKRLIEERAAKAPRLVLVGRMGWRVQDLSAQLQSTDNLNGMIQILHDLSDYELSQLYGSAMFTVFPSFEEGWGLPVGESLIFGRPCIASSTSSIPEVAGDFVDYIDPFNLTDGYNRIVKFIDDTRFREERAANIRERFAPRQWSDVAGDLIQIVQSAAGDQGISEKILEPPLLKATRICRFGHGDDLTSFIASGDAGVVHFAFDTDWYPVENFGRWMRGKRATLAFTADCEGDEPILIVIETHTVGWLEGTRLQLFVNEVSYPALRLRPGTKQALRVHAVPSERRVRLQFQAVGEIKGGPDPRKELWFGLGSLGYARHDDALGRVMLLEELMLGMAEAATLKPRPEPKRIFDSNRDGS